MTRYPVSGRSAAVFAPSLDEGSRELASRSAADAVCAAVDWGSSSFRAWLFDREGRVLGERRGADGLITAAERGFETVLEDHLVALGAAPNLPVVACGMVGARQGWREATYHATPVRLADVLDGAVKVTRARRDVRILPGIAQHDPARPDVMRGEETQLAGAVLGGSGEEGLVCLPGTHSKWALVDDGTVTGFATWMTGELFMLVCEHSMLRLAMGEAPAVTADDPAFVDAVDEAFAAGDWSRNLFALRAGSLLGLDGGAGPKARLSGWLIGAELAAARERFGSLSRVVLLASGSAADLYEAACRTVGVETVRVDADAAVRTGLFAAARRLWPERLEV